MEEAAAKRPAAAAVAPQKQQQQQSLENFLTSNVPEGAIILPPGWHFEIIVQSDGLDV